MTEEKPGWSNSRVRENVPGRLPAGVFEIPGNTPNWEKYARMDQQVFATRSPCEYETVVDWPNGRPATHFLSNKFPIFDGDGEVIQPRLDVRIYRENERIGHSTPFALG